MEGKLVYSRGFDEILSTLIHFLIFFLFLFQRTGTLDLPMDTEFLDVRKTATVPKRLNRNLLHADFATKWRDRPCDLDDGKMTECEKNNIRISRCV